MWKHELVRAYIAPIPPGSQTVEIGPGHGRWTEYLLARSSRLTLVDISQECLDRCRERFGEEAAIDYYRTDVTSLAVVADASVDFIWSFDSFVHMEPDVVRPYIVEMARVLRPGGRAVIHHAAKSHWAVALLPITSRAGRPGRLFQHVAGQRRLFDNGCRADTSAKAVARWAHEAGLTVIEQTDSWGDRNDYNVRLFRDKITVLAL